MTFEKIVQLQYLQWQRHEREWVSLDPSIKIPNAIEMCTKSLNIEEKYCAFDKFDKPGTACDDAVRILNGFQKILSYRLSENGGLVVNISVPLQIA